MTGLEDVWGVRGNGWWRGYALAAVCTAGAVLLRWALPQALAGTPYLAFYPAVVAAAAFGGLGPGLAATIAAALCVDLLFDQTPGWVDVRDPVVLGRLLIFLAGGVGTSVIAGIRRGLQARERRQTRELAELAALTNLGQLLVRDEQDRITRWSEGCARLYGFTAEQAVGAISHELLGTQFPQPLPEIWARLRREGRWEGELVHRRADGRTIVVASLWVFRQGTDGTAPEVLELNNDITEQKRFQTGLLRSEQRLRASFDNAALGIVEVDERDRVIAVNQRLCQLLGYAREELIGLSVHDFTAPEDRSLSDELNAQLHAGQRQGLDYDKRYLRRDGARVWVHVTVSPVRGADGRHVCSIGTVEDISLRRAAAEALRESERKYRIVADHTYHWEFWLGPDGRVLYTSPSCREVTGYEAEAFIADRELMSRIVHPDDRQIYGEHYATRRAGCGPGEAEFRIIRRDGAVRWMAHACRPVYDTDGKYLGIRGSNRDITEKKAVEHELAAAKLSAERAKAAAEQANRAKDHFLAMLSHELRTPLTPVLAAVSVLEKEGDMGAETRECLEVIRRNVKVQARLIDDLLDVSRITRGKVELERQLVEIGGILRHAVEVCRPDLEARHLQFDLDVEGSSQLIWADPGRMQQVFWNLLKNAIKFTPEGGRVSLRSWREDGQAVVEVSDSGMGIEAHALGRIFDPFDQGEPNKARQFGGLGLGLAISKALVEMHGGSIGAASPGRDQGATFTVRLPISAAQAERAQPVASEIAAAGASNANVGARILLVEDHDDTARILERLLRSAGHQVEVAADIATALAQAAASEFDLLISDLGLPDGSGVDLLHQLRSRGSRLPAIAMTGYGQEEDVRRTREAGFVAHLTKPIELQQLERAIASAC